MVEKQALCELEWQGVRHLCYEVASERGISHLAACTRIICSVAKAICTHKITAVIPVPEDTSFLHNAATVKVAKMAGLLTNQILYQIYSTKLIWGWNEHFL